MSETEIGTMYSIAIVHSLYFIVLQIMANSALEDSLLTAVMD